MRAVVVSQVFPDRTMRGDIFEVGRSCVRCHPTNLSDPDFDPRHDNNAHRVLVHVEAFSCNYRDLAILHERLAQPQRGDVAFGSEFSGVVEAVGQEVTWVEVGDRVMGDNSYPWPRSVNGRGTGSHEILPGVPTNEASREWAVFHENKLMKIPDGVSHVRAAAFSLNAQTVYSMVRRLELKADDEIVVASARSNVAICSLQVLLSRSVSVTAITTSPSAIPYLERLGVPRVVLVERPVSELTDYPELQGAIRETEGFTAAIDPCSDVYLLPVVQLLAPGGRYVTCGIAHQLPDARRQQLQGELHVPDQLRGEMILKNLTVMGNCLGFPQDLDTAVLDLRHGVIDPVIDSVYSHGQESAFFERTFFSAQRFGKVIYCF